MLVSPCLKRYTTGRGCRSIGCGVGIIVIIHWFRRDLRLVDNTALHAAAQAAGGAVLPVFIFDEQVLFGRWQSASRTTFLLATLQALDADLRALGLRLVVRHGAPLPTLLQLARAHGASGVFWNRDYTPYAIRRDGEVKAALREAGLEARSFKDAVIFELNEVVTAEGRPYTVYTPYARSWRRHLAEHGCVTLPTPLLTPMAYWPVAQPLPTPADLGATLTGCQLPPAGTAAAVARLRSFAVSAHGLTDYAEQRNLIGVDGTSRLSPYLRLGALSVRMALRTALDQLEQGLPAAAQAAAESWIGELIWRDFYSQILYHFPYVLRGAFRPAYDSLNWENDPDYVAAWQAGRTGYPVVDAAIRQLHHEGWMHNRARMIVASFLTKDLLVDWRRGEAHFMHWLIDGDPAANNGGWQWAAGTGTDAQPYFRIFNPTNQGRQFDPQGLYVRRYLPELANVPLKFLHTPHLMAPAEQLRADVQIGRDYPLPIVEHKARRMQALALYGAVRRLRDLSRE